MPIHSATDDMIAFMNSLLAIDREAVTKLLFTRVPCNAALANHPTVQVAAKGIGLGFDHLDEICFEVGVLGILNGFAGSFDDGKLKGWGPISVVVGNGLVLEFKRTEEVRK